MIFENRPDESIHHKNVIKDLKQHRFNVEEITLVKKISNLSCDVIAKDEKGYRSYLVSLERNSKFDYGFRIFDIRGQKLVSKYQWKEGR